jgi:invasion protein IalB
MLTSLKPLPVLALPVLALVALAAPLAAQEEAPAAPAEEPPAEAAPAEAAAPEAPAEAPATGEAATDPGLDLGEPVEGEAAEPQPGQAYVREEFGDWSLRCLRVAEGEEPCQLYQLLQDQEGNSVAEISLFPLPEGQPAAAGATIVTPLETLLTEELTLSVDGGAARRYPFTFCNPAGCVARVGFTPEEVQQFRAGSAAQLTIVPAAAPDQTVDLAISLTGFTAGFENATVLEAAAE